MSTAFLQRPFPNANCILLDGPHPILVDSGAPGHAPALFDWLGGRRPALLVNTHWHSDHTGGNQALAGQGIPIAAAAADAVSINAGDPDACRSAWLRQPVPAYRVSCRLTSGDILGTGASQWRVVALPGHTAAQIGLFDAKAKVLVAGDAVHATDVGWLDLDADTDALEKIESTLDEIERLAPCLMLSGHGPAITDVPAALRAARRRTASWRTDPTRIAWHACKRIFGHLLHTEHGLDRDQLFPRLIEAPWLRDHASRAFDLEPAQFVPRLLTEMLRARAAAWQGNRLMPLHPGDTA